LGLVDRDELWHEIHQDGQADAQDRFDRPVERTAATIA
jgi:hypothetical protein